MGMAQAAQADRFNAWLQQVNQACGAFAARPLGQTCNAALEEFRSGALKLSIVDVCAAQLYRGPRELSQGDDNHYYAVFQLQGQARMEQGTDSAALQAGDITLIDAAVPSNFLYSESSRQLSLILPRPLVEKSLQFAEVRCAQRVPGHSPIARLASRLIVDASRQSCLSLAESEAILGATLDLLRPAISATLSETDAHERLLRKALALIDTQITDESLRPESLARDVGVSVRGLYRLFARKNLVVAQYIRNRRLDLCAESLRCGQQTQNLSTLGYAWGFSSYCYFSTAFKARFGLSPSEYRKQHRG